MTAMSAYTANGRGMSWTNGSKENLGTRGMMGRLLSRLVSALVP